MKASIIKLIGKLIVEYGPSIVEAILQHKATKEAQSK